MAALIDIVTKGSTDRSVTLRIIDNVDGTPETGVVFNTAGIDLWYRREGAAKVAITEADLATPALTDPHLDGGFLHIADGDYRLDLPDAAFATGANHFEVGGTVTGMIVIGGRVRLIDEDIDDATRAARRRAATDLILTGTVNDAFTTPTATTFAVTGLGVTANDRLIGRPAGIYAGGLAGEATVITDAAYDAGNDEYVLTVESMSGAPSDGDSVVVL